MTEMSPVTHLVPPLAAPEKPGSIGPPIPGTECRLVDPDTGADARPGEPGELWMRGPQVMQGYLNNPKATAAMIDDEGWLHSGDVAVVDEDGWFTIVDRVKELIKYKGFQVAPAELEAILITHPQVADCAVIGIPDDEAGELPKAFVVPAGDDLDTERSSPSSPSRSRHTSAFARSSWWRRSRSRRRGRSSDACSALLSLLL